jgi:hypothetical protein
MIIDDHAIDSLKPYFQVAYEELKKEWQSNQYERLSHCPSFKAANTYITALTILIKGAVHADETQLKQMIEEDEELERLKKR